VFTALLHSNGLCIVVCFKVFAKQRVYTPQYIFPSEVTIIIWFWRTLSQEWRKVLGLWSDRCEGHDSSRLRWVRFHVVVQLLLSDAWETGKMHKGNLKGRSYSGYLGIKKVEILKWILEKEGVDMRTRFILFRISCCGGILWTRQWTFGFYKMCEISWLIEWSLDSNEGLWFMESDLSNQCDLLT
jgi:hypothetical protein